MNKEEFLKELAAAMTREAPLSENTALADIPEWDSLASMGVVSLFEERLNKEISLQDVEGMETVADLVRAAGV